MSGDNSPDLSLDQQSLDNITQGLRDAIGELKAITDTTDAETGAGFHHLSMTGMEAGHPALADDFASFCDRWEWGVRALVHNASDLADRMGLAAGTLWEEDQYREGAFKVAVNAAVGDPHLSDDQVEKGSWGDLFAADAPDLSADSFGRDTARAWQDTGRGLTHDGIGGAAKDIVDGAGEDGR